ncbi:hypothetical protein BV898_12637 [Hypsibius exemplaris]|uniref:Uncharacterized protein n=1 Tax=Hypsibius exemplaris TaxID=2072580 RepID=A0A1W0WD03_HYPEX|nr:hypothetical protein BV898_12637 [Hypsibius exemplaris]
MPPPPKKNRHGGLPSHDESDSETLELESIARSPSRSRWPNGRLDRYRHHNVREALGLGAGRQKRKNHKFSREDDMKLIQYMCTEGVKKYGGAFSGYGMMMGFSLANPEIGDLHSEQSLHNRVRMIRKNIDTFAIKQSWKDMLRPLAEGQNRKPTVGPSATKKVRLSLKKESVDKHGRDKESSLQKRALGPIGMTSSKEKEEVKGKKVTEQVADTSPDDESTDMVDLAAAKPLKRAVRVVCSSESLADHVNQGLDKMVDMQIGTLPKRADNIRLCEKTFLDQGRGKRPQQNTDLYNNEIALSVSKPKRVGKMKPVKLFSSDSESQDPSPPKKAKKAPALVGKKSPERLKPVERVTDDLSDQETDDLSDRETDETADLPVVKSQVRMQKQTPVKLLTTLCSSDSEDDVPVLPSEKQKTSPPKHVLVAPTDSGRLPLLSVNQARDSSPEIPFRSAVPVIPSMPSDEPVSSTPNFDMPKSPVTSDCNREGYDKARTDWNISPITSIASNTAENIPKGTAGLTEDDPDLKAVRIFAKYHNITVKQVSWALFINNGSPLQTMRWLVEKSDGQRPQSPVTLEVDQTLLRDGEKVVEKLAAQTAFSVEDLHSRLQFLRMSSGDLASSGLDARMDTVLRRLHKHRFTPPAISE